MPIKRRNIPTIEGVTRQMQAFEFRYSITTDEFLRQDGLDNRVDEDDAIQWQYLREQLYKMLPLRGCILPYQRGMKCG